MATELSASAGTGAAQRATASRRPGDLWTRALGYWLLNFRRTWRGSVFSAFLSPVLFLASMGFGLGALVDAGEGLGDVPYAAFVAPGILAATAMQTAVGETTYPVMGAIKWQRQYHAMLAAPLGVLDVVLGHLGFALLRVLIGTAAFLAVAGALGAWESWAVVLALPVALLLGAAHAAPVMAFSARQDSDGAFAALLRFAVMPMFLFAGTFFPVTQLPGALQAVARATPLWHGTEVVRGLSLGGLQPAAVAGHLTYLLLWACAGVVLAQRSYRSRLSD